MTFILLHIITIIKDGDWLLLVPRTACRLAQARIDPKRPADSLIVLTQDTRGDLT